MAEDETSEVEETETESAVTDTGAVAVRKQKKARSKQQKKLIRRRVSKTETAGHLPAALRLTVESGRVEFGTRRALALALHGKSKVMVLSGNAPLLTQESIRRYCGLSNVPLIEFPGSSLELGSVCGRPHSVAVLAVQELGTSNLLDFVQKKKG